MKITGSFLKGVTAVTCCLAVPAAVVGGLAVLFPEHTAVSAYDYDYESQPITCRRQSAGDRGFTDNELEYVILEYEYEAAIVGWGGRFASSGISGTVAIPSTIEVLDGGIGYQSYRTCQVIQIKEGAFGGCTGLTEIDIPSSVKTIGYQAFGDCTGLTKIDISNGVETIGFRAFEGCTGLTEIDIPSSVETIEYAAFAGCTGLTSITIMNPSCSIDYVPDGCTLYGHAGSAAEAYAQEHEGVTFRLIGEEPAVTLYGDADCNGEMNIMDVILLNRNLMIGAEISEQGMLNSDVNNSGSADAVDSLNMLKAVVKLITLPV